MDNDKLYIFAAFFVMTLGLLVTFKPKIMDQSPPVIQQPNLQYEIPQQPTIPEVKPNPQPFKITTEVPSYLPYRGVVNQIQIWNKEAPELTEIGTFGKSSKGQDIYFIRVTNKLDKREKPEVLVHASIHGNESHSSATVLAYIGSMLAAYGKDEYITKLINERDIYFVPVLSPDSYPNRREVDGVDPNRDYVNKKSAPIRAIQDFCDKHKFKAGISFHTWGRVFLGNMGNTAKPCIDDAVLRELGTEMGRLADYRYMRACELYNGNGTLNNPPIRYGEDGWSPHNVLQPIFGTEIDYYYLEKGMVAYVAEIGTHQRLPSDKEVREEFNRTYKAFQYFLDKAPLIDLKIRHSHNGNLQQNGPNNILINE